MLKNNGHFRFAGAIILTRPNRTLGGLFPYPAGTLKQKKCVQTEVLHTRKMQSFVLLPHKLSDKSHRERQNRSLHFYRNKNTTPQNLSILSLCGGFIIPNCTIECKWICEIKNASLTVKSETHKSV